MSSLFRSQSSSFAWPSIHDDGTSLGQLRFRVLEFRVSGCGDGGVTFFRIWRVLSLGL